MAKIIQQSSDNLGTLSYNNSNLYTYGDNQYGQLGHNNKTEQKSPKLVEYFESKDIKIKEAICGEHHTIALG